MRIFKFAVDDARSAGGILTNLATTVQSVNLIMQHTGSNQYNISLFHYFHSGYIFLSIFVCLSNTTSLPIK